MASDDIDDFLVAGSREIGDWPVESFLLDVRNFFERQIRLRTIRRGRFLVTFDELARQPAEHVIGDAGGVADVGIFCETARFEPLIREFFYQTLERHAVLKRDRSERADGVHQTADGAALLRHGDKKLARLAVLVQADGDVTFVPGDLKLVC